MKRGEHIKNWRQRYFVLHSDGRLMGYRSKPADSASTPSDFLLNNFTVRGCQIMTVDRPKPFTFIIRGLQWTTVIERTFAVESELERQQWTEAIRNVSSRLIDVGEVAMTPSEQTDMTDVDMATIAEDELSEQFSVQGTTCNSSGVKKVVSTTHLVIDQGRDRADSILSPCRLWRILSSSRCSARAPLVRLFCVARRLPPSCTRSKFLKRKLLSKRTRWPIP